jgi:hypothetical protein
MRASAAGKWSYDEFGRASLGDVRRTRRLVAMAARAVRRPSGKVSAVYDREPERAGAYDFLENPQVTAEAVARPMFEATARRASGEEYVFVAIDGSSLALPDTTGSKNLGPIGNTKAPVRGLKVMNALAVSRAGVPLGLIDQIFWNRAETPLGLTATQRTMRSQRLPFEEKEAANFVRAATHTRERLEKEGVRPWFVIDREGDNRDLLLRMHDLGCPFTIRGRWDRGLFDDKERSIHEVLDGEPSLGQYDVDVPRNGRRAARKATVDVRAALVTLRFPSRVGLPAEGLRVHVVRVRETNADDKGLEWLLLTNVPTLTATHARAIVDSYRARWRVEEFHRTWKQGGCNVEDAQLRSVKAIEIWATLLAAVAMRIERLKYLARSHPDEPASVELTDEELEALALDQRQRTKARGGVSARMPSIGLATRWLAELGGWLGARNGPPGSIVLSRGLERLGYLVEGIALARTEPIVKKRGRT